ncbi:MAG: sulfotransferase [Caulobacteraceae bacterium]
MTPFIVLTRGRTGSTAICTELNSHPDILCYGEIARPNPLARAPIKALWDQYGPDYVKHHPRETALPLHLHAGSMGERKVTAGEFAAWVDYLAGISSDKTVGFKMLENHAPHVEGGYGSMAGCRVVVLNRHNLLRQAVSSLVAVEVGKHNNMQGPSGKRQFTLDADLIAVKIRRNLVNAPARDEALRAAGLRFVEVFYEDFVKSPAEFYAPIFELLEVAPAKLQPSRTAIMTPEPLRELLTNYDEVAGLMTSLGYERFLADA